MAEQGNGKSAASVSGPEKAGVVSVIVMLPLILLVGEVTPKTIAVSNPVRFAAGLAALHMGS